MVEEHSGLRHMANLDSCHSGGACNRALAAIDVNGNGGFSEPARIEYVERGAMMSDLANRQCVPCRGGIPPLTPGETAELRGRLDGWEVVSNHHLAKSCNFPDFAEALAFVNKVGAIAEEQGHHPDLYLAWGLVRIEVWTHKIDGLTESDFILAAKIDAVSDERAEEAPRETASSFPDPA